MNSLLHNRSIGSNEYTPTAVFQFIAQGTEEFLIKASAIE